MKPHIGKVAPVERPPYNDIIWSGDTKTEVPAPVIQTYAIDVHDSSGSIRAFDAEVRQSPHGEQIDWDDDLDDYLFAIASTQEAEELRQEINRRINEARGDRNPTAEPTN